jgi:hypothetical protein
MENEKIKVRILRARRMMVCTEGRHRYLLPEKLEY